MSLLLKVSTILHDRCHSPSAEAQALKSPKIRY
jgi:hypothetical protein